MDKAREKLVKGRAGLILDMPFFGSLSLRLELKEDDRYPTGYTDGKHLGYNPEWIESLSLDEAKGFICHEVMHCAAEHTTRRGDRDKRKWNLAGDYTINPLIEQSGITLPKGGCLDHQYDGMYTEEVFRHLPEGNEDQKHQEQGDDSSGQGEGGQDGDQNQGGGGEPNPDPGGCGGVEDAKDEEGNAVSPAKAKEIQQDWKVSVVQAAAQAQAMGEFPSALERMIDEIVNPKVDWRDALRRFVDSNAKNDYQWFPPNRRYIHRGLILPSLRSDELGKVAVAIDTSGSIGTEEINQFASELSAILEEYRASCTVIYCDADVAGVEEVSADDLPLQLKPVGGGGTDFRPPFRHIEEAGMNPVCMIYFTDGYCNRFPDPPDYPVLWVVDGHMMEEAPFGEVIQL